MSAQSTSLRELLTGVSAQINADRGQAALRTLVHEGFSLLAFRDSRGEIPKRENVEALATQIHQAAETFNASAKITVPTVAEVMAAYDAASEV